MRLTKAIINLKYLKNNFLNIRKKVGNAKIMAVVKADAYGHNVKYVTETFNSLGKNKPEYFAVAIVEEGIELRELGIKQPILIFDPVNKSTVNFLLKHDLIPTVFTENHLNILIREKKKLKLNKQIKVHVKINTGMNRLGVDLDKAVDFIKKLNLKKDFIIDGIYTHFASSDVKEDKFTKSQIKNFNTIIKTLKEQKINYGLAHAANSGAILNFPEAYFDMVRPGISLYGYYPSHQTLESIKLYPVLSLVSKVSTVTQIKKGDTVSYNRKFKTTKPTKIISVSLGYADGFRRGLTNKAKGIIKGKVYNQIGAVTMDRIMFDVGNDKIKINDDVILIGEKGKFKIDAWDWADILDTIPYEITCGISKRVQRVIK